MVKILKIIVWEILKLYILVHVDNRKLLLEQSRTPTHNI